MGRRFKLEEAFRALANYRLAAYLYELGRSALLLKRRLIRRQARSGSPTSCANRWWTYRAQLLSSNSYANEPIQKTLAANGFQFLLKAAVYFGEPGIATGKAWRSLATLPRGGDRSELASGTHLHHGHNSSSLAGSFQAELVSRKMVANRRVSRMAGWTTGELAGQQPESVAAAAISRSTVNYSANCSASCEFQPAHCERRQTSP